jgi:hypothetical protein
MILPTKVARNGEDCWLLYFPSFYVLLDPIPCNTTVLSFVCLPSPSSLLGRLSLCILTKLHECFIRRLEVLNLLVECWLCYCLPIEAIMALHRAIRQLLSLCLSHHPKLQPSMHDSCPVRCVGGASLSEEQMTIPQRMLLLAFP